MAKLYSTLAVEKNSTSDVIDFLKTKFRLVFLDGKSYALGLNFDVYEAPEEWLHGSPMFDELAEGDDRFYREFDVSTFKVSVDLFCGREFPMADCVHVVADCVARIISSGLKTRVLVFFEDTPYCLYALDEKQQHFPTYYAEYVKRLAWIPRGLFDSKQV